MDVSSSNKCQAIGKLSGEMCDMEMEIEFASWELNKWKT